MAINWNQVINNLKKSDIADHLEDPSMGSLIGSDAPLGFFTDKPLESASNVCTMLHWIEDNSPFKVVLSYDFESFGSKYTIKILWKDQLDADGQHIVAKKIGPFVISGRTKKNGDFARIHQSLGFEVFKKIGKLIKTLKENNP